MKRIPVADAHNDYLMNLRDGRCTLSDGLDEQTHISLPSLREGNVKLQVFAAFVCDPAKGSFAVQALELIHWYDTMLKTWGKNAIVPVTDRHVLERTVHGDAIGALLSIEGGEACGGSLGVLDAFRRLGVRIMTLVWNHENEIGFPALLDGASKQKLKPFGRLCVDYMCKNNMSIDVSHLNTGGFWDAYAHATKPMMASHSNAYALCPHPRNLDDDQIRAIIQSDGFIGLNFFPTFLREKGRCCVGDIVTHARHILSLGGEDILGFGSDFDGIPTTPEGIHGAQDFPDVLEALERAGIGTELIEKISFRNFFRYISGFLPSGICDDDNV